MAETPERIGKYRILSRIAEGGMGSVYRAKHPTLQQELVIKRLTMQDSGHVRERFRREAQIMFQFKSEYIVDVYDHFRDGEAYHIVQEYIDGISLEDLIDRERYLPEHIALPIFLYAARALNYAHARKVVHRDIKPGNILISKTGQVKLVDFGIASIRDQVNDQDLTQIGMTLGTPSYMAPEQFTSSRDVDKRADIYSLGVMLYEMLTGKKPYPSGKLPETYQRIIKGKYTNPRKHNPNISDFSIKLIKKCMQPKLKRRYQDLSKVLQVVEKQLRIRPIVGIPFETAAILTDFVAGKRTIAPRGRFRTGRIAAAAAAAILTVGILATAWSSGLHNRIFQPHYYGGVQVDLYSSMPTEEFERLPHRVQLLSASGEQHELTLHQPITNWRLLQLLPEELRPEVEPDRLTTFPVYLVSGQYQLQAEIGTQTYHHSVYIHPHDRRFSEPHNEDNNRFTIRHANIQPRPLRVSVAVKDLVSGRTITPLTRIEAFHNDRFYPLDQLLAEQALLSGGSTHFRISRPGYYSQEPVIATRHSETEIQLQSALVPRPGHIAINSNDPRVRLRINGSRSYTKGGPEPRSTPVPMLDTESAVEIALPPGRYTLQATRGRHASTEIGFQLQSDDLQNVSITYDQEKESLTIQGISQGELP